MKGLLKIGVAFVPWRICGGFFFCQRGWD